MRIATLILSALGAGIVLAGEPTVPMPTTAPSQTGRVAVLDNHALIEGDIERYGDQYRIRRTIGETWIPAQRVLYLGPNQLAAYEFLMKRANLRDVDERMRLTRWCLQNNLRAQALEQAKAASQMRPKDTDILQMVHGLEQMVANAQYSSSVPAPQKAKSEIVQASAQVIIEEDPLPIDFNTDAMTLFVTRVQPILMNTCASCHAAEGMKAYPLVRVYEGSSNRVATQHNLAATLQQIRRDNPIQSPIIVKALTPHGDSIKAPIRERQSLMYRTLEFWVQNALLRSGPRPEVPVPAPAPVFVESPMPKEPTAFGAERVEKKPMLAPGDDPFDPAGFNGPAK